MDAQPRSSGVVNKGNGVDGDACRWLHLERRNKHPACFVPPPLPPPPLPAPLTSTFIPPLTLLPHSIRHNEEPLITASFSGPMTRHDSCLSRGRWGTGGNGGPPTGRLSSATSGGPRMTPTAPTIRQWLWFPATAALILCGDSG